MQFNGDILKKVYVCDSTFSLEVEKLTLLFLYCVIVHPSILYRSPVCLYMYNWTVSIQLCICICCDLMGFFKNVFFHI